LEPYYGEGVPVRDGVKSRVMMTVTTVALVFGVGRADSQSWPPDPLGVPASGTVMCRAIPTSSVDSISVMLDLSEESSDSNGRESRFAFDSSGAPIFMSVVVSNSISGDRLTADLISVRFSPFSRGVRQKITQDSNGDAHVAGDRSASRQQVGNEPSTPIGITPLTDAEFVAARRLAAWVWGHRCNVAISDPHAGISARQ